ncbi:hypothetical protein PHLCEN_2v5946 [Hermanssonia centrifuga]|uniref:Uncharacterized protein n=1 Tax=Hermanssonia centrifuga TaxID=98765 RepID=A0A2R6P0Z2_9APHY|nr:hypothetical protein PHLCEN_2v5946 [Hermanssonia centrifuga]
MVGYLDHITMNDGKSESWNVKRPAGENGGAKKIWRRVHAGCMYHTCPKVIDARWFDSAMIQSIRS